MTTLSEMILDTTSLDNRRDLINSIKALIGVILALVIAVVLTVFLLHEVNSVTNDFFSDLMPTSTTSRPHSSQ
jgi:archaellum biogenesis protein FlaJ (TadC family)